MREFDKVGVREVGENIYEFYEIEDRKLERICFVLIPLFFSISALALIISLILHFIIH